MSQIFNIRLEYPGQDGGQYIFPSLFRSGQQLVLVDCGYPGFLTKIENAMQASGFSLSEVTAIVITHHDLDHVGSLAKIRCRYPGIRVYSSAVEAPFIEGKDKAPRLLQAEAIYEKLDAVQKIRALEFQKTLESIETAKVDGFLAENESPWPDIEIIETPGHTPGHISLLHRPTNTLIAGDAVVLDKKVLEIANPQFTLNLPAALKSVAKLEKTGVERIFCYHGGVSEEGVQDELKALLRRYNNS